ncbi:MAG: DUF177 domain-containing protein [Coriobacteriia bacterium]|nr:DUF177 domain-containing protein [Coriobacteriia bacterium]MCL2537643.1 DUF177 domain-containing protein [Coriobacteriia bacterium]
MSIVIDLRSVIDEGVGASLKVEGTTAGHAELEKFHLGSIEYCCTAPIIYEFDFLNAGECVQTTCKVHADVQTDCVRCLEAFDLAFDSDVEETYFFTPTDDEHGEPYPVIPDDLKVDVEPLLLEALLVEAPFAPVHDEDCQGLCMQCGADLNKGDCGCDDAPDASHPLAGLKDLIK